MDFQRTGLWARPLVIYGVDHSMGRKPWASAFRLISRNALASGLARLLIDAVIYYRESSAMLMT